MTGTVMVTGGAGFIGARLVDRLLREGHEVHVFDVLPREKARRLQHVLENPNLNYFQGDLRDAEQISRFYRPDASHLYHLASIVGVPYYLKNPLGLIDVVVLSTRVLLELAQRHGTRVLFTSTSEIYGRNPNVPWSEDSDRVLGSPAVDRWSYSSSKAVCEHMLYALHRGVGLKFSTVRFFNIYGPGQSPVFVVSQSIYNTLRGESPLLYDSGQQTRCFTYVDDAIEGVMRASTDENAIGEAFNIGSDVESTICNAIDTIIEEAGNDITPVSFNTGREYGKVYEDIPRRVPNVTKARELLGWKADTSLQIGIRNTISWARANGWWLADHPSPDKA